jgi:hypothetical protein
MTGTEMPLAHLLAVNELESFFSGSNVVLSCRIKIWLVLGSWGF